LWCWTSSCVRAFGRGKKNNSRLPPPPPPVHNSGPNRAQLSPKDLKKISCRFTTGMRKESRDRNEEERRSATTAIEVFEARGGQTPQCSIPSGFRRATFLKRNRYASLGPNRREESTSPFDRGLRISTRHLKHCLSRISCELGHCGKLVVCNITYFPPNPPPPPPPQTLLFGKKIFLNYHIHPSHSLNLHLAPL
jgi:hypothetical protein